MKSFKLLFLEISFVFVCRVIDRLQYIADRIYNKGAILEFNLEKQRRKETLSQEIDTVIRLSMRQAKIQEARRRK
jgi:hypothetical protein